MKKVGDKVIETERALQGKADPGPVVAMQIKKLRATRAVMEKWKLNNFKGGKQKSIPDPQPPESTLHNAHSACLGHYTVRSSVTLTCASQAIP